jgi:outer membrane protein OmpA-like peptidoglycan-associated protein
MRTSLYGAVVLLIATVGILIGCAGKEQSMTMATPPSAAQATPPPPKQITFPNGTVFGGASGRQASSLAQIMVDANNNNMQEFAALQKAAGKNLELSQATLDSSEKNLATSKEALELLENLMKQQGTGDMTLFFPTGSSTIKEDTESYTRLVRYLDYISVKAQGRKVLLILIGSASSTGTQAINERLSRERAEAPIPIVDKYLVNAPHEYYKVYGLGDFYAPKGVTDTEHERYQNVRVIAVYDTDQVPDLPDAQ